MGEGLYGEKAVISLCRLMVRVGDNGAATDLP